MKADTLIRGGTLLTPRRTPEGKAALAAHEALVVAEGRILAVGRLTDLEPLVPPGTKVIDLEGGTLLPGFNDAHVHIWKVGQLRTTVLDLRGVDNLETLYERVAERAAGLEPSAWLWGRGWNEATQGGAPERGVLDRLVPDNPVLLTRTCAHIHAVNTRALEAAHITPDTHVPGGEIDPIHGILTETAYGLVYDAMPAPTQEDFERWILAGCEYLKTLGVTSATDPAVDPPLFEAYRALDAAGRLPIRVNLLHIRRPDGSSTTFPLPPKHLTDRLRCDSVKFFADGGLSGATAAISRDYRNVEPPSRGVPRFETEELFELSLEAHRAGFRIGTHAIGDRALEQVLSVYERLYEQHPTSTRHRLEHFGLPNPSHLERARKLDLAVVPQPVFLSELRGNFERYLPESFHPRLYNLRAMCDAGLTVAFSSDGPVVRRVAPLAGIHAAINAPMCAGNELDLSESLWAYTVGGAVAQGDEGNRGSLRTGAWADFVVLEQDPRTLDPEGLETINVIMTSVATKGDISTPTSPCPPSCTSP